MEPVRTPTCVRFTRRVAMSVALLVGGDRGSQARDMATEDKTRSIEPTRFDAAAYLTAATDQAELMADAVVSGDTGYISHALGVVARVRGMTQVERDTCMKRQALYRAPSKEGNPTLDTLLKVTKALGLRFTIEAASA